VTDNYGMTNREAIELRSALVPLRRFVVKKLRQVQDTPAIKALLENLTGEIVLTVALRAGGVQVRVYSPPQIPMATKVQEYHLPPPHQRPLDDLIDEQ
jgi:hypothetical protein